MPTIKETLINPILHAEFKRFLEAEYAEESLVLWNEIEAFKKLAETGATPAVINHLDATINTTIN